MHAALSLSARTFVVFVLVGCGGKTEASLGSGGTDSGTVDGSTETEPPIDYARCSGPGGCSLVASTCCGTCGTPTASDYAAIGKGTEDSWRKSVCGPEPVGCPACAPVIFDGSLQAWCRVPDRRCEVVDVRDEPVSACETDADCVLRHAPCCEPCEGGGYDLVALARTQVDAYRSAICTGAETCSRCISPYPDGARAYCDAGTKHCRVQLPGAL